MPTTHTGDKPSQERESTHDVQTDLLSLKARIDTLEHDFAQFEVDPSAKEELQSGIQKLRSDYSDLSTAHATNSESEQEILRKIALVDDEVSLLENAYTQSATQINKEQLKQTSDRVKELRKLSKELRAEKYRDIATQMSAHMSQSIEQLEAMLNNIVGFTSDDAKSLLEKVNTVIENVQTLKAKTDSLVAEKQSNKEVTHAPQSTDIEAILRKEMNAGREDVSGLNLRVLYKTKKNELVEVTVQKIKADGMVSVKQGNSIWPVMKLETFLNNSTPIESASPSETTQEVQTEVVDSEQKNSTQETKETREKKSAWNHVQFDQLKFYTGREFQHQDKYGDTVFVLEQVLTNKNRLTCEFAPVDGGAVVRETFTEKQWKEHGYVLTDTTPEYYGSAIHEIQNQVEDTDLAHDIVDHVILQFPDGSKDDILAGVVNVKNVLQSFLNGKRKQKGIKRLKSLNHEGLQNVVQTMLTDGTIELPKNTTEVQKDEHPIVVPSNEIETDENSVASDVDTSESITSESQPIKKWNITKDGYLHAKTTDGKHINFDVRLGKDLGHRFPKILSQASAENEWNIVCSYSEKYQIELKFRLTSNGEFISISFNINGDEHEWSPGEHEYIRDFAAEVERFLDTVEPGAHENKETTSDNEKLESLSEEVKELGLLLGDKHLAAAFVGTIISRLPKNATKQEVLDVYQKIFDAFDDKISARLSDEERTEWIEDLKITQGGMNAMVEKAMQGTDIFFKPTEHREGETTKKVKWRYEIGDNSLYIEQNGIGKEYTLVLKDKKTGLVTAPIDWDKSGSDKRDFWFQYADGITLELRFENDGTFVMATSTIDGEVKTYKTSYESAFKSFTQDVLASKKSEKNVEEQKIDATGDDARIDNADTTEDRSGLSRDQQKWQFIYDAKRLCSLPTEVNLSIDEVSHKTGISTQLLDSLCQYFEDQGALFYNKKAQSIMLHPDFAEFYNSWVLIEGLNQVQQDVGDKPYNIDKFIDDIGVLDSAVVRGLLQESEKKKYIQMSGKNAFRVVYNPSASAPAPKSEEWTARDQHESALRIGYTRENPSEEESNQDVLGLTHESRAEATQDTPEPANTPEMPSPDPEVAQVISPEMLREVKERGERLEELEEALAAQRLLLVKAQKERHTSTNWNRGVTKWIKGLFGKGKKEEQQNPEEAYTAAREKYDAILVELKGLASEQADAVMNILTAEAKAKREALTSEMATLQKEDSVFEKTGKVFKRGWNALGRINVGVLIEKIEGKAANTWKDKLARLPAYLLGVRPVISFALSAIGAHEAKAIMSGVGTTTGSQALLDTIHGWRAKKKLSVYESAAAAEEDIRAHMYLVGEEGEKTKKKIDKLVKSKKTLDSFGDTPHDRHMALLEIIEEYEAYAYVNGAGKKLLENDTEYQRVKALFEQSSSALAEGALQNTREKNLTPEEATKRFDMLMDELGLSETADSSQLKQLGVQRNKRRWKIGVSFLLGAAAGIATEVWNGIRTHLKTEELVGKAQTAAAQPIRGAAVDQIVKHSAAQSMDTPPSPDTVVPPRPTIEVAPPASEAAEQARESIATSIDRDAIRQGEGPLSAIHRLVPKPETIGLDDKQALHAWEMAELKRMGITVENGKWKWPFTVHKGAEVELYTDADGQPHVRLIAEEGKTITSHDHYHIYGSDAPETSGLPKNAVSDIKAPGTSNTLDKGIPKDASLPKNTGSSLGSAPTPSPEHALNAKPYGTSLGGLDKLGTSPAGRPSMTIGEAVPPGSRFYTTPTEAAQPLSVRTQVPQPQEVPQQAPQAPVMVEAQPTAPVAEAGTGTGSGTGGVSGGEVKADAALSPVETTPVSEFVKQPESIVSAFNQEYVASIVKPIENIAQSYSYNYDDAMKSAIDHLRSVLRVESLASLEAHLKSGEIPAEIASVLDLHADTTAEKATSAMREFFDNMFSRDMHILMKDTMSEGLDVSIPGVKKMLIEPGAKIAKIAFDSGNEGIFAIGSGQEGMLDIGYVDNHETLGIIRNGQFYEVKITEGGSGATYSISEEGKSSYTRPKI